jgi:CheY-like chemotaxis protein
MEEQLRQSQKLEAVGRLAGGIAHDFNNLLTVILGYSDMLLHTPELNERLQGSVRQVHRAAEQAASLTRQLLAFGRKQLLQSRPLNLNGLIGELEPMLRRLIGENILMDLDLQADPADIVADPAQINQVVMNLVLNARDAMPEGGRLSIETRLVQLDAEYVLAHPVVKPGDYVQLAVGDSGIGMDRETQEHMFEPFFSTKEKGKGTGLGLATVYGIVKQSGGYVWVYSELGSGSVFKIYLPLAAPAQADCAPPRPPPASGGNETVLVVEDKPEVRALVRDVLTPAGYAVYEVDSPEAALRFCRESGTSVQLLLTDVVLPGMNGAQLASEMTTRYPQVRVLYMSGYTDNAIVRQRILAPGKNYLQKPFTPGDLLRRVREALDG